MDNKWGMPTDSRSAENYDRVGFSLGCMMAGLLICAGIVAWQVFMWLKHGHWFAIGVTDGLLLLRHFVFGTSEPFGEFAQWLVQPESWSGVHHILEAVPASIASLLLGFALGTALMPLDRN